MYLLNYDPINGKVCTIQKGELIIPIYGSNADYQAFIKWNSGQKEPLNLNSTLEVVTPPHPRDLASEIDELKAQVAILTTKVLTK